MPLDLHSDCIGSTCLADFSNSKLHKVTGMLEREAEATFESTESTRLEDANLAAKL